MRFLVDAQLPPALARMLTAAGHLTEHVADVGLSGANDSAIWDYACANEAILITKDEDFPHRLSQLTEGGPVVVWIRLRNTSRRALLEWFDPLLPQIIAHVNEGERLIEVR